MNIFVLSEDPIEAARMQCDKHVVKMPLETAQLLCSVFEPGDAPYKRTHYNHPCSIWTRMARSNFLWLCEHGFALCDAYTQRFGKVHASQRVIAWCHDHQAQLTFPQEARTPFAIVMDDVYKQETVVQSYRTLYSEGKRDIARWDKCHAAPDWWG